MKEKPEFVIDPATSYEQALEELEAIVRKVEEGQLPLEEALQQNRKAQALLTFCQEKLDQAKGQITPRPEQSGASVAL